MNTGTKIAIGLGTAGLMAWLFSRGNAGSTPAEGSNTPLHPSAAGNNASAPNTPRTQPGNPPALPASITPAPKVESITTYNRNQLLIKWTSPESDGKVQLHISKNANMSDPTVLGFNPGGGSYLTTELYVNTTYYVVVRNEKQASAPKAWQTQTYPMAALSLGTTVKDGQLILQWNVDASNGTPKMVISTNMDFSNAKSTAISPGEGFAPFPFTENGTYYIKIVTNYGAESNTISHTVGSGGFSSIAKTLSDPIMRKSLEAQTLQTGAGWAAQASAPAVAQLVTAATKMPVLRQAERVISLPPGGFLQKKIAMQGLRGFLLNQF